MLKSPGRCTGVTFNTFCCLVRRVFAQKNGSLAVHLSVNMRKHVTWHSARRSRTPRRRCCCFTLTLDWQSFHQLRVCLPIKRSHAEHRCDVFNCYARVIDSAISNATPVESFNVTFEAAACRFRFGFWLFREEQAAFLKIIHSEVRVSVDAPTKRPDTFCSFT